MKSIYFFSLSLSAQKVDPNKAGHYNLSATEIAAGLVLLEDADFYYYTSCGNVDLIVIGQYGLNEYPLILNPDIGI